MLISALTDLNMNDWTNEERNCATIFLCSASYDKFVSEKSYVGAFGLVNCL